MSQKADWIQIRLPVPGKDTHTQGYIVNHDAIKGYSLHLGYDESVVIVPHKKEYENMLKELYNLLEMQKTGIKFWLNRTTRRISTNKT